MHINIMCPLDLHTCASSKPVFINSKGRSDGTRACRPSRTKTFPKKRRLTGFHTRKAWWLVVVVTTVMVMPEGTALVVVLVVRGQSSSAHTFVDKTVKTPQLRRPEYREENEPNARKTKKERTTQVPENRRCRHDPCRKNYTKASADTDLARRRVTFLLTVYTKSRVQKWYICACAHGIDPKMGATSGTMT